MSRLLLTSSNIIRDPHFADNQFLVTGHGTNGAQNNTFIDSSTNNATITRIGHVNQGSFSPNPPAAGFSYNPAVHGGSGYFDATASYLSVPSGSPLTIGTNSATIELWMYPRDITGYHRLVSATSGAFGAGMFAIRYNNGNFIAGPPAGNFVAATSPTANAWHHIAWVGVSGTSQALYVDGILVGTAGAYNLTTAIQYFGGYYTTGPSEFFNGHIASIRIDNTTALYSGSSTSVANFTLPSTPLPALAGTALLINFTNAGIIDKSAKSDLETLGNAQFSTSVPIGGEGSILYDGTGDGVLGSIITGSGTGDITVEVIGKLSTLNAVNALMSCKPSSAGSSTLWNMKVNSAGALYFSTNVDLTATPNGTVTANSLFHAAYCRSGTNLRCFFEGVQIGSNITNSQNFANARISLGSNNDTSECCTGNLIGRVANYARYTSNFNPLRSFAER